MYSAAIKSTETSWIGVVRNVQVIYCKTIRSEYLYSMHSKDIHFFFQYLDITYYSDPACFGTFYCSTIHCPFSNLKFLIFSFIKPLSHLTSKGREGV